MSGYHPCDRHNCPEWNQGQCFGGGCSRNPIRERDFEDAIVTRNDTDDEDEINDEWFGEEDNHR